MEKQKLNINFWWMFVIILLAIAISSAISIVVCHYMQKEQNNISTTNEIETTPTPNEVEENNQETDATKLIMPITLNNNKHELTIECTLGEKQYYGPMGEDENYPDRYPQTIKVSMDGKEYKTLENKIVEVTKNMPLIAEMPNIVAIKSKEGKDYIAVIPIKSEVYIAESVICILDEEGEIVGKIKDYGRTKFILEEKREEYITSEEIPSYTINEDSIDIIKPGKDLKGAEIHRYVIEEGKIKVEGIIKKYTDEEITKAGVKYSDEAIESNHIYE